MRDGIGWEGLAQVRTNLAHPETSFENNDTLTLGCIRVQAVDVSLSNITHIDQSKLYERNTSWETVIHEHLNHFARSKITTLYQCRSNDHSWINDGQSELLVLG